MSIDIDKINKEMWIVKNITLQNITIGDLPKLPVLKPNKTANLLKYYNKEKIINSNILTHLVQNNKITIEKKENKI